MIYKIPTFIITLFASLMFVNAQNVDISGVVVDQDFGEPLPGVNLIIKGSSLGASTDFDGNFAIKDVPINSILVVSYIGYKTVEITITNSDALRIVLVEDAQSLDEVVVIGYGSQKKRDVTGAVSIVDSQTIDDLKPVKVEQALQGTVSGVNVTTQSGAPGAGLDIRIRGIGTNGQSAPTVIIDGYVGDINVVNPNDIESITVLKDAQAAIYGTIGANGIILITTKTGKLGQKTKVSYNSWVGFQESSRKLPLLNATEYGVLLNETYVSGGQAAPFPNVSDLGVGTNWQNNVFNNNVPIINHDFNVSGGSEKITYAFSGSHVYQQGIIAPKKTDFRRNTARLALGAQLTEKIKFSTNVNYTYLNRDSVNDFGLGSVLFNGLNAPPTLSPFQANGDFSLVPNTPGLGIEIINPLAQIFNTYNDFELRKLNGTVQLDYDMFNNFTLTSRIGFNTTNQEGKGFFPIVNYGGKVFDTQRSSVNQNKQNFNDYSLDIFGTYTNSYAEKHNISVTAGTTVFKEWGTGLFATGFDVPNNSWDFADISLAVGTSGEGVRDVGSFAFDDRRLSFFARLQYDFKGKYLFSAVIRRDSSTRFGPGNQVGYFPSVTAGWVISDEKFFGEGKTVNFMKFRSSYGILGNDQIGSNRFVGLLNGEGEYVLNGNLVSGLAIGGLPNPDIKWEEAIKFNLGMDLNMFNNKIDLTADYFIDTRKDLLIPGIPVSGILGTNGPGGGNPVQNAGTVRNSGFEFAIGYKEYINEDFNFGINYNFTTLRNEVTEVNNGVGFIEGGSFGVGQLAPSRMQVGFPLGYFYGYKTDGIFQNPAEVAAHPSQLALGAAAQPGDLRFVDVNGDGVIDANDRTNLGDPIPDITMGLNFNFNYKNIDFVMYTFASIGNEMVRNYERALADVNRQTYWLDRWRGEGTSNSVPRLTTAATSNFVFSDFFVEDASYIRIQNVQVGYSLPQAAIENIGFTKVRIYIGANNLYTFTKYRGYDPGASTGTPIGGGIDAGFYPIPRTYLMGVNFNF